MTQAYRNSLADRPDSAPPGHVVTELGLLPQDWRVADIDSFNPFVTSGSRGWASFYSNTGSPFIRITNLSRQCIDLDLSDMKFVTLPQRAWAEAARTALRDADLLISVTADIGIIGFVDSRLPKPAYINQHIALIRFDQALVCPRFVAYSLASERPQQLFRVSMDVGVKAGMNLQTVRKIRLSLPGREEQHVIADALSDVDGLIDTLEKVIAKKRAIKQAAMQQLLTGKTRLPGFSGEWGTKQIGNFTDCTAGGTPSTLVAGYWGGSIRWMNSGELNLKIVREVEGRITERGLRESSTKLIPPLCVLIGLAGQGRTRGTVAMNLVEVCINQSIAAIFPTESFVSQYLYFNLDGRYDELRSMSTGDGGRGGLNLRIIRTVEVPFPSIEEQTAIATVLSDMDAEIQAIERRTDKTRQIKQGMMQQLLTGRSRLAEPQKPTAQADAESNGGKAHNWAFNEAVVVSALAKHFGKEDYPLGRKRYTKLSYLLHRHAEKQAHGYLKKAAGPYNPKTRYGGPERIALENGYIREHKAGPYCGFVAAEQIAEAERYFEKWYGPGSIQWLNQFRFKKNEELEVLATVDMAAEERRAAGKKVDVAGVKDVISSHPEWQAKLQRSAFSDSNIAKAIQTSHELFDSSTEPAS